MGATTSFTHDYNGRELLEIFSNVWYAGEHSSRFTFLSRVDGKQNLYLNEGGLKKVMKSYTGCGQSAAGTLTITDRVLEVQDIYAKVEQCEDVFNGTVWDETFPVGNARNIVAGTELGNFLVSEFVKGLTDDWVRVDWFGNTASGTNADYIQYDGFFKYLTDRAIVPSGQFIDLDNATYQTSGELATDAALRLFKDMTSSDKADITLRMLPKSSVPIYCTPKLLDNYVKTLRNQGNVIGQGLIQNGQKQYFFDDHPIIPMYEWEQHLLDSDNPFATALTANGGHVALLTTPKNMIIGSDIGLGVRNIKSWYSEDDEKFYTKSRQKRGTTYFHSKLFVIAY